MSTPHLSTVLVLQSEPPPLPPPWGPPTAPGRDALHELAFRDTLTGLPNRLLLRDRAERAIAYARRRGTGVYLLFIGLDGFGTVNDRLGQAAGDGVLKDVAQRIGAVLRMSDTLAREGGDEFVVLLDDNRGEEVALRVAERILAAASRSLSPGDDALAISASIGIARFPEDGDSANALICNGAAAMHRAKAAGGGRFRFHAPGSPACAWARGMDGDPAGLQDRSRPPGQPGTPQPTPSGTPNAIAPAAPGRPIRTRRSR